jgi:hypothetical protein
MWPAEPTIGLSPILTAEAVVVPESGLLGARGQTRLEKLDSDATIRRNQGF